MQLLHEINSKQSQNTNVDGSFLRLHELTVFQRVTHYCVVDYLRIADAPPRLLNRGKFIEILKKCFLTIYYLVRV